MNLSSIIFASLLLVVGADVKFMVTITNSDPRSTCTTLDFNLLQAFLVNDITRWFNDFLKSDGDKADFAVTAFGEEYSFSSLNTGTDRKLDEDPDELSYEEEQLDEDPDDLSSYAEEMHRRLGWIFIVLGNGKCDLCNPDNKDRNLRRRLDGNGRGNGTNHDHDKIIRMSNGTQPSWQSTRVTQHINQRLSNDVQKFVEKIASNQQCFSSISFFNATFQFLP